MELPHNCALFVAVCAIGAGVGTYADSPAIGWIVFGVALILQVIGNLIFEIKDNRRY